MNLTPVTLSVAANIAFAPAGTIAATNVQAAIEEVASEAGGALDATLTAWGGVTFAADTIGYATGADAFSTTSLTAAARTLLGLDAATGSVLYASGPNTWAQGAPDTAGLVAKSGTQTGIAGDKDWTGKHRFRTPTTADSFAQVMVCADGSNASNKGLVIQGTSGASGNLLEIQNSGGSVVHAFQTNGSFIGTNIELGSGAINLMGTAGAIRWFTSAAANDRPDIIPDANRGLVFKSGAYNGASAIGFSFNTGANLSTSGALLVQVSNQGVVKATIDKDGGLSAASLNLGGATVTDILSATAPLDFDTSDPKDLTLSVTGAAVGDAVCIGVPHGSVSADAVFFGWVSATDVVTIRKKGTSDPASGTFRALVIKI